MQGGQTMHESGHFSDEYELQGGLVLFFEIIYIDIKKSRIIIDIVIIKIVDFLILY